MSEVKRAVILGGSGMLGYTTSRYLAEKFQNVSFVVTARGNDKNLFQASNVEYSCFDFKGKNDATLRNLLRDAQLVVNCIGLTWQRAGNFVNGLEFNKINFELPMSIESVKEEFEFDVIHVGTDCVFAGKSQGHYVESDFTDATDLYGKSKSLADNNLESSFILRSSVIGRSLSTQHSLLDWFLGNSKKAAVRGFTNHYWNGIGALQFAKIIEGLIKNRELIGPHLQHVVPYNSISKYDLLGLFAKHFCRTDIVIEKFESEPPINRTLSTQNPELNSLLWANAGYHDIPNIEDMVREMSEVYKKWKIL